MEETAMGPSPDLVGRWTMADAGNPGSAERERALLEYTSETVYLMSENGEMLARVGNPLGPLGYPEDSSEATKHPAEHVHPDDLLGVLEMVGRVRANPGTTESITV